MVNYLPMQSVLCVHNTLIINTRLCIKIPSGDKRGTKIRIAKEIKTIKPFQKTTLKCRESYLSLILLFCLSLGLKVRFGINYRITKSLYYKFSLFFVYLIKF